MLRRAGFAALIAVATLAPLASPALAAKPKGRKVDLIRIVPDFASYGVKSIAILPAVTYDKSLVAETKVPALLGRTLVSTGYRWVSAQTVREMLRSTVGDSVVKVLNAEILKSARVDSLRAPLLCAKLRTDAVLSVRVDLWEQMPVLWNQSGRPATTVQLSAALVDSSGALLWSAEGSETGEGTYHDPNTNPIGVSSSNLENTPVTGQGGPPPFDDVLNVIFLRWQPQFPPPAGAAEPAK
jgi:hypothetical protein